MAYDHATKAIRINNTSNLPTVWHVSGDYPDPFDQHKTPVIARLLELTDHKFDHRVVSINRVSPRPSEFAVFASRLFKGTSPVIDHRDFDRGVAVQYRAPPKGLLHATVLKQLGHCISDLMQSQARPALIVAHKLSIEGIAVAEVASEYGIPYAVSIQGDTDTKILAARPDLKSVFAKILHDAAVVFPFTPWALDEISAKLGPRKGLSIELPCPTELDAVIPPTQNGRGLVSIFHLRNHRRKNLVGIAAAARILRTAGIDTPIEIIGGGSPQEVAKCEKLIEGVEGISLVGRMERNAISARLNGSIGMVLPSKRESYGLVFLEALFAGSPVIYPKGQAISGYFEGAPFALAVNASSPREFAEAMRHLVENEVEIKGSLAEWQGSPDAQRFMRPAIGEAFGNGLESALNS